MIPDGAKENPLRQSMAGTSDDSGIGPTPLLLPDETVHVCGLSRARRIKRRYGAVLSIVNPGLSPSKRLRFHRSPKPAHMTLSFEDLDGPEGLGPEWLWRLASADQVATALAFGRRTHPAPLLVHCHAGISRSTAIALAIIADRLGPGHEQAALARLIEIAPFAVPNLAVVRHADALLARAGRLHGLVLRWDGARAWNAWRREQNHRAVLGLPSLPLPSTPLPSWPVPHKDR